MNDVLHHLQQALADRYRVERQVESLRDDPRFTAPLARL